MRMGPMTPPVDSRAPVCARLDRVRVRVLGEPRGICSINRARAICVRACAQVRERVRVRACVRVSRRMRARFITRACASTKPASLSAWWSRLHGA